MNQPSPGIAFVCDRTGRIQRILGDQLVDPHRLESGSSFPDSLAEGSRRKGLLFLETADHDGAAFDWELDLPGRDSPSTFHFGAGRTDDGLVVVGSRTKSGALALYEEVSRIDNAHMARLREVVRGQARDRLFEQDRSLHELTQVNNELTGLHRELARQNAELERVQAQRASLIGMVAHDLRNPLGAVQTFSTYLEERLDGRVDPPYQELLGVIRKASGRMLEMVQDLLDAASVESGGLRLRKRFLDPCPLVRECLAPLRLLAQAKGIRILEEIPESVPSLDLDPGKFEQVIHNLVSNAIKYSRPDSEIEVSLRDVDQGLELSVLDHGVGIALEEQKHLFSPWSRAGGSLPTGGEPSTGLGLAIVKRLVEGHGGRMSVRSSRGEGACFVARIPRLAGSASPASP